MKSIVKYKPATPAPPPEIETIALYMSKEEAQALLNLVRWHIVGRGYAHEVTTSINDQLMQVAGLDKNGFSMFDKYVNTVEEKCNAKA